MPRLTDERRKQIQNHKQNKKNFWDNIETKYHKSLKRHSECRLCGEMITALEPKNAIEAMIEHEKKHPEYEEWVKLGQEIDFSFIRESLHDHDCIFIKCACKCGCQFDICVTELPKEERYKPMICSMCELYQNRGRVEHRLDD
jgi:hypothetical protein